MDDRLNKSGIYIFLNRTMKM